MAFDLGAVVAHFTADIGDFKEGVNKVIGQTESLTGAVFKANLAAEAFKKTLGFVVDQAKSFVNSAAGFEQTQVAFKTMLGSAEEAEKLLRNLANFAKATPFQLTELEDASKRLLAFGTAADDLIPTLTMLGNIAAGVGTDKMPQLVRAFGQIQAKGFLMGQELLQLTETGIPIIEELAKV